MDKIVENGIPVDPKDLLAKASTLQPGEICQEVAQLAAGDSFGELALLYSKPRMATIKCIERSHFIVLSKADYNGAIAEIERRKTNEKINFIKMLPVFSKLSRTQ